MLQHAVYLFPCLLSITLLFFVCNENLFDLVPFVVCDSMYCECMCGSNVFLAAIDLFVSHEYNIYVVCIIIFFPILFFFFWLVYSESCKELIQLDYIALMIKGALPGVWELHGFFFSLSFCVICVVVLCTSLCTYVCEIVHVMNQLIGFVRR